MAAVVPE
jgi:hypothetical protein